MELPYHDQNIYTIENKYIGFVFSFILIWPKIRKVLMLFINLAFPNDQILHHYAMEYLPAKIFTASVLQPIFTNLHLNECY